MGLRNVISRALEAPVAQRILQHSMVPWTKLVLGALAQTLADHQTALLEGQLVVQWVSSGCCWCIFILEQQPLGHPPSLEGSLWRTEPTSSLFPSVSV